MNYLNDFIGWVNTVQEVNLLTESKGHMDHPEDMVILGALPGYRTVSDALAIMDRASADPKKITIKFDGYPAVIFGAGADGKFTILDKHMFNRADRPQIYSPQQFAQYEAARGEKGRTGLVNLVSKIWTELQKNYQGPGYYMGDLLFHDVLQDDNGVYKFRPNPNGILYQVQVDSDLGGFLTNKIAGIAVHRWLAPEAQNTEDNVTWLSDLGNLKNVSSVALLPVSMPVTPDIKLNQGLRSKAEGAKRTQEQIYTFINSAPQNANAFANLFTVYLNSKIVQGNLQNLYSGFMSWIKERLDNQLIKKTISQKMRDAVLNYINDNKNSVRELFNNWIDIYNYKMDIVKQIDRAAQMSPIKGYLQTGQESQEGFVYGGLKFVDRQGFSAQNLAARQSVAEAGEEKQSQKAKNSKPGRILVIYPGGFHPFHPGHASVFDHLAKRFPGADVFIAASDTTKKRPFEFDDKKFLANQSGVPNNRFVQVKSPYRAEEITSHYDPQNTMVIFAMSMKDENRVQKLTAPKIDGSPSKYQIWTPGASNSMDQTYYIYLAPTSDFKVLGKVIKDASMIRSIYTDADDKTRKRIISDLYPLGRAPKKIKDILDHALLGGMNEADNPNYFGGSSQSAIPGTPDGLRPQPDAEDIRAYQKEIRELKRFMGH